MIPTNYLFETGSIYLTASKTLIKKKKKKDKGKNRKENRAFLG